MLKLLKVEKPEVAHCWPLFENIVEPYLVIYSWITAMRGFHTDHRIVCFYLQRLDFSYNTHDSVKLKSTSSSWIGDLCNKFVFSGLKNITSSTYLQEISGFYDIFNCDM